MQLFAALFILGLLWLPFYATTIALSGGSAAWVSATLGWVISLALCSIVRAAIKD